MYDYNPGGGAQTHCWSADLLGVFEELVVDSGVCIQIAQPTGNTCLMWDFEGCDLICSGRNPNGFDSPNQLQEATGMIPGNALEYGTREEDNSS